MKIVLAGSSGFVGSRLIRHFKARGDELIILSRHGGKYFWDPSKGELNPDWIEGADCIINLCGKSLACRWTAQNKRLIVSSRLEPTALLVQTIRTLKFPPKLYIGASAVGYYSSTDEPKDEDSPAGEGYLSKLCSEWEALSTSMPCRVVLARFGMILGKEGGSLAKFAPLFRWGLGGKLGNGSQIVSWIAMEDVVGAIDFALSQKTLSGPVNFVAPTVVTNQEFTQSLARALKRPTFFKAPTWALSLLLGEGAQMLLESQNVIPNLLLQEGYAFQFPTLDAYLKKIFAL